MSTTRAYSRVSFKDFRDTLYTVPTGTHSCGHSLYELHYTLYRQEHTRADTHSMDCTIHCAYRNTLMWTLTLWTALYTVPTGTHSCGHSLYELHYILYLQEHTRADTHSIDCTIHCTHRNTLVRTLTLWTALYTVPTGTHSCGLSLYRLHYTLYLQEHTRVDTHSMDCTIHCTYRNTLVWTLTLWTALYTVPTGTHSCGHSLYGLHYTLHLQEHTVEQVGEAEIPVE